MERKFTVEFSLKPIWNFQLTM